MADVVWPTTLQKYVNVDGFTYNFGDTLLRSENAIGPAKVRRLTTRPVDTMQFSIDVPFGDYPIVNNFYNTTINGGATRFVFTHPISRLPILVRCTKPPVLNPMGGQYFKINFEVEVLP